MQDFPLTIPHILRRGESVYADSVVTDLDHFDPATGALSTSRKTFAEIGARSAQLANALRSLGITGDERVGTFAWNHSTHIECYLGIPSMGAVLHTLNIRLFPEQLTYVVNHGDDRVIIVDGSLVPVACKVAGTFPNVRHFLVVGDGDHSMLGEAFPTAKVHDYEAAIGAEPSTFAWRDDLDERSAAAMCYTSGTTGNPKGVAYSHRSTFLHSMAITSAGSVGVAERDKALIIVPMFHANAWGLPYAAFMAGCDLIMPRQYLQAAPLGALIKSERPTLSSGVPTIWNDLYNFGEKNELDLSSLRFVTAGGSAVPRVLMQRYQDRYGVKIVQGWGMTETSPVATLAIAPKSAALEDDMKWRDMAGRVVAGVEIRIALEDESIAPADGATVGEIEIRGPWVTASYYKDPSAEKFHDGWLRTGDMGTIDGKGFIRITDRTKDVIKSGGEWVSSLDLENAIMAHPAVLEAAVIAVPDPKWDERPMACVVLKEGASVTVDELKSFLDGRVAKWWLPERWAFIDAVPKTSVGKFDKKVLRAQYGEGTLTVDRLGAGLNRT